MACFSCHNICFILHKLHVTHSESSLSATFRSPNRSYKSLLKIEKFLKNLHGISIQCSFILFLICFKNIDIDILNYFLTLIFLAQYFI